MKDFYWDIRPKPEFGTIEMRVCDTPLHIGASRGAGCRMPARWRDSCWRTSRWSHLADVYRVYGYNRFLACRFDLEAEIIDPYERRKRLLAEDIAGTRWGW